MSILHLGHQPADLSGVTGANLSTDAAAFDADLDVNGLRFEGDDNFERPFLLSFAAPSGDLWLQVRCRSPDITSSGFEDADTPFLSFFDGDAALLARLRGQTDGAIEAVAEGDSRAVGATSFTKAAAMTYWIDVTLSVGPDITIAFYVDGILQSTATANNAGAKGKPVQAVFNNAALHRHYRNGVWFYAHIAATDGLSTIGRRFARQSGRPHPVGRAGLRAG